jgi:tRNA dimethylallyltransferase
LVGPTGTGKSRLAVSVALRIGGEVVGCDALQVYCGLDAATAKPNGRERERVPHWLLDIADPRRDYSLADYVRDADAAIAAIHARRRVPIVVGGTGMYLRGLLKGIVAAPPRDAGLRERLNSQATRFGSRRLHRLLASLDAASALRVPPQDAQRVVRALELALSSGETWSARLARMGTWSGAAERYRAMKFGLDLDRQVLADRLAARVDAFLAADLSGEIDRLLASGVPETANAFKGIGYREVLRARLERRDPKNARDEIVVATRQYAKRQRTWFRKEPGLVWIDAARGSDDLVATIVAAWNAAHTSSGVASPC